MSRLPAVLAVALLCPACVTAEPDPPAEETPALVADPAPDEGGVSESPTTDTDELVGQAQQLSLWGDACGAICAALQGYGCWAVADACLAGEVLTVGGATIPCAIATAVACPAICN